MRPAGEPIVILLADDDEYDCLLCREAMEEIKRDPELRRIPVIVMTTSKEDEDVLRSYDLGASGFIAKPVTFEGLVEVMIALGRYWAEIGELPKPE